MVWAKNDSKSGKPVLALVGQYHKDLGHPTMRLPANFLSRSSLYSLTAAIEKWNKEQAAIKAREDRAAAAAAKKAAAAAKKAAAAKARAEKAAAKAAGGKGKVTPKKSTTPKTTKPSTSILDQIKKALAPPKPAKTKTAKPTHANTSPDPFLTPDEIALLKADERNPARRPLHKTKHTKPTGGRIVDTSQVPSVTGLPSPASGGDRSTPKPKAPAAGSTAHPYQPPQITAPTIAQGSAHTHQPASLAGASVPPHRTTSPATNYAHQGGFVTGQHSYYEAISHQQQGGFVRPRATSYQPNNYSTAIAHTR